MGKDKRARAEVHITVMAIANLIAAIVDTMRNADMPPHAVFGFLDELERLNGITLWGAPGLVLDEIIHVVRRSVPSND